MCSCTDEIMIFILEDLWPYLLPHNTKIILTCMQRIEAASILCRLQALSSKKRV